MPHDKTFVSTSWLASQLGAPGIAIIDASWYLPDAHRDAHAEYLAGHIPGAVFFDIDGISDHASPLPHMLPDPVSFSSAMRKLGLGNGMKLVVYDSAGLFSAPRVWWTLKTFGVRDVAVLAGGLPKWKAEGRALEDGPVHRQNRHFTARLNHGAVANAAGIRRALAEQSAQVVDARSEPRFQGAAPEPRPGLRAGHIPGSLNLPWGNLLDGTQLKPAHEIEAEFVAAGVDLARPVITTCGSGISAAILALALESLDRPVAGLFDGSWAQWGADTTLPIATGPAGASRR